MGVKGMISKDEHRVTLLGSGLTIVCWWTSLDRGRPEWCEIKGSGPPVLLFSGESSLDICFFVV